jgi:hypothetical protein
MAHLTIDNATMKYKYGYRRGLPDHRDFRFAFSGNPASLPVSIPSIAPLAFVFNQTNNDCTANSTSYAIKKRCLVTDYKYPYVPSRRDIYYTSGLIESNPPQDNGRVLRDCFQAINSSGVCPEDENAPWNFPYTAPVDAAPPQAAEEDALFHKLMVYSQVNQDKVSVQSALVNGMPLVIGISVFQSIEDDSTAQTGIIPMPGLLDAPIGGHALCVDSYDENYVSGPNSWGSSWGANPAGYFHLPWDYLLNPNLCSDIWSIGLIT